MVDAVSQGHLQLSLNRVSPEACLLPGLIRPFQFRRNLAETFHRRVALEVLEQGRSRREGPHPLEQGVRFRHITPEKKTRVSGGLGAGIHGAAGQQGLNLGGEPEGFAVIGVVQGLDAKGIPAQKQAFPDIVPDGKGIHAPQPVHHGLAGFPVEMEQDLGITVGLEVIPPALQPVPQFPIIINFAVEYHPEGLIGSSHGLGPGRAQINNRETAVGQRQALIRRSP